MGGLSGGEVGTQFRAATGKGHMTACAAAVKGQYERAEQQHGCEAAALLFVRSRCGAGGHRPPWT